MTTTLTRESLEGLAHVVYVAGIEATSPQALEVLAETAEAVGVSPSSSMCSSIPASRSSFASARSRWSPAPSPVRCAGSTPSPPDTLGA